MVIWLQPQLGLTYVFYVSRLSEAALKEWKE